MSCKFSSLQLQNPELFGIRLAGGFGRAAKQRLQELTAKCIAKEKIKLVLDLSELKTIGGSGAAVLADLQRQLQAHDGEAVFLGANETVKRFLVAKFEDLPLRLCETPAAAEAVFAKRAHASPSTGAPPLPPPAEVDPIEAISRSGTADPNPVLGSAGRNDGALDELLGSFLREDEVGELPEAAETAQASKAPGAAKSSKVTKALGPTKTAKAPGPTKATKVPGPAKATEVSGPTKTAKAPGPPKATKVPGPTKATKAPAPTKTAEAPGPPKATKVPGPAKATKAPAPTKTAEAPGPPKATKATKAIPLSVPADADQAPKEAADRVLDEVLATQVGAAASDQPQKTGADPPRPSPGSPAQDPAPSKSEHAATCEFISLADAVHSLRCAESTDEMCQALSRLLHSHDLAADVVFYQRQDQQLIAEQGGYKFDLPTAFTEHLLASQSPVMLLDIPVEGLAESEARQLEEIDPDLILPLVWHGQLQAIAFLHHGKQDHEYGISDHLALEMLMHLLAENGERAQDSDASTGAPPAGDPQQSAVSLALSERIFSAEDETKLWAELHAVMAQEGGIKSLIHVDPDQDQLGSAVCLGMNRSMIPQLNLRAGNQRAYFAKQRGLLRVTDLPDDLQDLRESLSASGMTLLVPLHSKRRWLGILILAEATAEESPRTNHRYLEDLCRCTTIALEKLRGRQELEDCNLSVLETLISLQEKRLNSSSCPIDQLVHKVRQLAREVSFPAPLERDLVCGALLRDIGMIPLGDLVGDLPQTMTQEQLQRYKAHPTQGARLLETLPVSSTVKDVVLYHHERYKGDGYPCGLKGQEIPLAARIVAVAESYVEMHSNLPNRDLARQQARAILLEDVEGRFDPVIVEIFVRFLEREDQIESQRSPQPAGV